MQLQVDTSELRKLKIMIGTPMYGGMSTGIFTKSANDLAALGAAYGVPIVFHYLFNESLITRARNYIADEFLRSDCTHLVFIDSDIGFDARDVLALAYLARDGQEVDIIGGPYPKKTISWEKIKVAVDKGYADENANALENFVGDFVFNVAPQNGEATQEVNLGEPIEVNELGTGFMCIRRDVFEKMSRAYKELLYYPDHVRTKHFDGSRKIMCFFDALIDRGTPNAEGLLIRYSKQLLEAEKKGEDTSGTMKLIQEVIDKMDGASLRYLSEDYMFCHYARHIGLSTKLCAWMRLQHSGSYIFGGSVIDLARTGMSLTADPNSLKSKR